MKKNGFTLIETVIAIAILTVAVIPMLMLYQNIITTQNNLEYKIQGAHIAEQEAQVLNCDSWTTLSYNLTDSPYYKIQNFGPLEYKSNPGIWQYNETYVDTANDNYTPYAVQKFGHNTISYQKVGVNTGAYTVEIKRTQTTNVEVYNNPGYSTLYSSSGSFQNFIQVKIIVYWNYGGKPYNYTLQVIIPPKNYYRYMLS